MEVYLMNIQIFGTKKCFDTKKTERYFKERRIKFQFIDLNEKDLSKRELQSVISAVGINELINNKSKEYAKLNIEHIRTPSTKEEILLKNPKLYKTPIVRNARNATVGYKPEIWGQWE
jgi:arsenate reductase